MTPKYCKQCGNPLGFITLSTHDIYNGEREKIYACINGKCVGSPNYPDNWKSWCKYNTKLIIIVGGVIIYTILLIGSVLLIHR